MRQKRSKIDSANAEATGLVRSDVERANHLADWAFKESQSLQYFKGQADALKVFASLLSESNPQSAYEFATKALEIYNQIGDDYGASGALMFVAKHYQNAGWTTRSHYVLVEAYEKSSRAGNAKVSAAALFNLGVNAEDRGDRAQALEFYTRAKEGARESGNESIYWRALCAEQEMHYDLKNDLFDIQQITNALHTVKGEKQEESLVEFNVLLSKIARDSGDLMSSRRHLKRGYVLAKKMNDERACAEILCHLGTNRADNGRYKSAKRLLEIALKGAIAQGVRSLETSILKQLSYTYSKLGDASTALELMNRYSEIKDELFAHESKKHFEEMKTFHEVQLVEEESKVLRKKNIELAAVNKRLEAAFLEKQKLQKELERLVRIDELTGALNRRESLSIGNEIISRFHSQGRAGVVMIVDIDRFKSINDEFGHSIGDEVLRRFTQSCQRVLRPTDSFGRLGGEEFCILLDRTKLDIALKVAERVMKSIRSTRVSDIMGEKVVTASIGVVEVNKNHTTIEAALHDADLGLYEAKRTGRDKICVTGVKKNKAA